MRGFGDDRTVLYLDCGSGYTMLLSEFTEIYTKKSVFYIFGVERKRR